MLWLALDALHAGEIHRPREGRAAPALPCRTQLGAAVERAHPQAIGGRVGARGCRIERCAALRAERVRPLVPAFSSLYVDLWCSAPQNEGAGQAWHRSAKGGAGEGLAVCAMADSDLGRFDFGLEADLTAMAVSGDFHRHFSLTISLGDGRVTVKIPRLGVSSNGRWPRMDPASFSELCAWLTEAGLAGKSEIALLDGRCRRALDAGLPIAHATIIIDTLHPVHERARFLTSGSGAGADRTARIQPDQRGRSGRELAPERLFSPGIFPNEASITRLIGAVLLEQNDEWLLQCRYMQIEGMAELTPPLIDADPAKLPPLAA
jgi:hypothetical protein